MTAQETHVLNQGRPKILLVSVHAPIVPGPGGAVRAFQFANALADHSDVTLVCFGGPSGMEKVSPALAPKCQQVIYPSPEHTQRANSTKRSRFGNWARTIKTICLPWQNNWSSFLSYCLQYCPIHSAESGRSSRLLGLVLRNEFRLISKFVDLPPVSTWLFEGIWSRIWPQLSEVLQRESFSVIWFENSIYYPFIEPIQQQIPDARVVCNAANIEYKLQERLASHEQDPWDAEWGRAQVKFIKALEARTFRQCDLVITCSVEDQDLAKDLSPSTSYSVIGNGVDIDYFQPRSAPDSSVPTLLYTGSFRYEPNQDGLRYFLDDIFPLVLERQPDCRLVFAGFDAQELYDELRIEDPRVSCVSSPEDIRPCFDGVDVFVVPLQIGGGTRLKIVEAMSMEVAIVSTRIGAEGIPAEDGRHLLLADQPQEFADAVIQLIDDRALRTEMIKNASAWVREHYGWKYLCSRAISQVEELIAN